MKPARLFSRYFLSALLAILSVTAVHAQSEPSATIRNLEGDVSILRGLEDSAPRMSAGDSIRAWEVLRTNQYSKAFIETNTGAFISLGEFGSLFLNPNTGTNGDITEVQTTEGILRFAGENLTPYSVITPTATIQPDAGNVDFIVEVPTPTSTVVTVLTGRVRVDNLTVNGSSKTVNSCHTLYVEQDKASMDEVAIYKDDIRRLTAQTTIQGTLAMDPDVCTPVATSPAPSRTYVQTYIPEYYVEEYEDLDPFPIEEITILPPRMAGTPYYVILPGIGRWAIPVEVFSGWNYDPVVVQIYVKRILNERIIHHDRWFLHEMHTRRRQLENAIFLAQVSGNRSALANAQQELDYLRIKERWATRRLNNLENRVKDLDRKQHEAGRHLPKHIDLYKSINQTINSPHNAQVLTTFKSKIRNDQQFQGQLAGIAGREVSDLRRALATERDPKRRIQLHDEFSKIRREIAQGKVPLDAKKTDIKNVVSRIAKERDLDKIEKLQRDLTQIAKPVIPKQTDLVSPEKLNAIQSQIGKIHNPQQRQVLETKVNDLKKSVENVRAAETHYQQIDKLTQEAVATKDDRKRQQLVDQIGNLTKQLPAGAPGSMQLINRAHGLESQLSLEQDKAKREQLQKALDEQRHAQEELARKQQEQQRLQAEKLKQLDRDGSRLDDQRRDSERLQRDIQRQTTDQRKQTDDLKRSQDQQQQQSDKMKQDQEDQRRKAEDLRRKQEHDADRVKRDLEDQRRKSEDLKRLQDQQHQQGDKQRQELENQRRKAEELQRQQQSDVERTKRDLEDQRRKSEDLKRSQDQQRIQSEKLKQDQDEQRRRAEELKSRQDSERVKRETEEQRRRTEELEKQRRDFEQKQRSEELHRKQSEQQRSEELRKREEERRRDEALKQQESIRRQQEDQARKQQEMMRQQQEQQRMEQQRRTEEERRRQEQMRMQQMEQQRIEQQRRQQEDQSRRQQELMRQQEENTRRQQEAARHQMEQQRQQEQLKRQMEEQRKREEEQRRR